MRQLQHRWLARAQEENRYMITFIRSTTIAPGKVAEAMAFAQEAITLSNDKYGVPARVTQSVGGNPYRLAFFLSFGSLGDYETMISRLVLDADWHRLLAANADTFVSGSAHDEVWRSVL
jgi:hypothetical protein